MKLRINIAAGNGLIQIKKVSYIAHFFDLLF